MPSTDYLEDQIITHLLRTGSWTKPTAIFVALFVGGTGVTGTGYARVQHGPSDATWTATSAGNGISRNASTIQFGSPTANWGTITVVKLFSASSGGNELATATLNTPLTVNSGDPAPAFPANSLSFTVS